MAGTVGAADMRFDPALAQLNGDGTLDTSFGNAGTAATSTEIFAASVLTFDPQDRVLQARVGSDNEDRSLAVAQRFLTANITPPEVTRFATVIKHGRITALRLPSANPWPRSAGVTSSYLVVSAGPDGKFGTRDDRVVYLRSASYRTKANVVVLKPRCRLSQRRLYQLTAYAADLTDLAGTPLAGQGSGVAGTNYVVTFGGKSH